MNTNNAATGITPKGVTLKAIGKQANNTFMPIIGLGIDRMVNKKVGKDSLLWHGGRTAAFILTQFVPVIPKTLKNILAGAAVSSTIHTFRVLTKEGSKVPEVISKPIRDYLPSLDGAGHSSYAAQPNMAAIMETPVQSIAQNQPAVHRNDSSGSLYGGGVNGVNPIHVLNGDSAYIYNM